MKDFPFIKQSEGKDCGPTCLKSVAQFYGKKIPIQELRRLCETNRIGSNLQNISKAAEEIGFRTLALRLNYSKLQEVPLPSILHWNSNHFVVAYEANDRYVYISDPAHGKMKLNKKDFIEHWIDSKANENEENGIVLLLEPRANFDEIKFSEEGNTAIDLRYIFKYVIQYKRLLLQLVLGLIASSLIQFIFPFLTQSIVDIGIVNQNTSFILLVLIGQVMFFLGNLSLEAIRGWILLHLSTRINISLISDFFIKLMNLPISYFDAKMTGDLMQRISDHKRIQNLITNVSLSSIFSFFNICVFTVVLLFYSYKIFIVFVIGSFAYFGWISFFLKRRGDIDHLRFSQISQEQSKVIELINGMQEIKLNNAEQQKRWGWERIQIKVFEISKKGLALEQMQGLGSSFINQLKNLIILFISAIQVTEGEMTLGMMLSVQFIIGQLNSPLSQIVDFIRSLQDAKISLHRLNEIHGRPDENSSNDIVLSREDAVSDLLVKDVSFKYDGSSYFAIKNVTLEIPANKITAIVGASGSGKTSLMKLLLKFYNPTTGTIRIGKIALNGVNNASWRDYCGVVMQEGYFFNDTIANNIAIGQDVIDTEKLVRAVTIANIRNFIEELPLAYNTKIGNEGSGLSAGQKQRILIARAVYKDPKILFFDEATSSLDANNEMTIMNNLNVFFENKTVIIIAHRLSTVKNASQIIVMDEGKIIEVGDHNELVRNKAYYYSLVKNQLELN